MKSFQTIALISLLAIAIQDLAGAIDVKEEKWIGYYLFPGHNVKLPLYLELKIKGNNVSGSAVDGSDEVASVVGTIENGNYELLLHPLKHGSSKEQDVWYRGNRRNNLIEGKWVHVVGASGPWYSELTELNAEEALRPYKTTCENVEKLIGGCK